jgi:Immunity protein Imm1
MKVRYLNYQNKLDPLNGTVVVAAPKLAELLDGRRNEAPFIAELSGDNGYHIEFGIGGDVGFVQFSRSDGQPPYLVAVPPCLHISSGHIEFLTANTPTPVPARNILKFDELKQIALHFLQTGGRSELVSWESI